MEMESKVLQSETGAEAAWRGFSTQTLYIAKRLLAASAGQLSSNMEDTATAANNAKKALSGIDKLNNISSGSGADSSADSTSK